MPGILYLVVLTTGIAGSQAWCEDSREPPLAACCAVDDLLPPVRIEAGGDFIDTGACIGHSGPQLMDLDGNGVMDLLVGDFAGHIHLFRNTGGNAAPVYAEGTPLEADGKPIKVSNW
jgi:hypothetical protein